MYFGKTLTYLVYMQYASAIVIILNTDNIKLTTIHQDSVIFLEVRGLAVENLNNKQLVSKVTSLRLTILGYIIKYNINAGNITYQPSLPLLIPDSNQVSYIKKLLRNLFHFNTQMSSFELIVKINPILRSWYTYFYIGYNLKSNINLNQYLYRLTWNWARRKHKRWGKQQVVFKYFFSKRYKWLFKGQLNLKNCNRGLNYVYTIKLYSPKIFKEFYKFRLHSKIFCGINGYL